MGTVLNPTLPWPKFLPKRMETVKFNVGGIKMEASQYIINKYPGSKLALLQSKKSDVFLDMNPLVFLSVLDYLRTDQALLPMNISLELFLLVLKDLNIPAPSQLEVTSRFQHFGEPPAYSNIQQDTNSVAILKCTQFVKDYIHPLILNHISKGHYSARILVSDTRMDDSDIVNQQISIPVSYITLSLKMPNLEFLNQQEIMKILENLIIQHTSSKKCSIENSVLANRRENDFGLFETRTVNALAISIEFV